MYDNDNIKNENSQEDTEFLVDIKNNKLVNWQYYKSESLQLSASYNRLLKYSLADRVAFCGSRLVFKEFTDGTKKLHSADFCKVRLCPMCAWRRSKKIFSQVSSVMDVLQSQYKNYKYIFLTLTCRNVPGVFLFDELDKMFKAFNLLTKRKEFKVIKGYFRALEVTYNLEDDTYHPHFHVVLVVPDYYFTTKGYYIKTSDWVLLWQSCLKVDYFPICYVEKAYDKSGKNNIKKAVAEVSKYSVKPADYIIRCHSEVVEGSRQLVVSKKSKLSDKVIEGLTDRVVEVLDRSLRGRRLIAFGGIMKDISKQLSHDDVIDGDLIHTSGEDVRSDLAYILKLYQWSVGFGNYIKTGIIEE